MGLRVLQSLKSEATTRTGRRKRSPSSSERRRRRVSREEREKCMELDEFSAKNMTRVDWGDPWDREAWPCVQDDDDDDYRRLVELISRASVDEVNEASRVMKTWGTFMDDSQKYDLWRPTIDFLLCNDYH